MAAAALMAAALAAAVSWRREMALRNGKLSMSI